MVVNSGGRSAPEASHSAQQMRRIDFSMYSRVSSLKVRMFSLIVASSGMMFSLVPACSEPIVSTAGSVGAISRETMVCSRSVVAAAMITGSIEVCGCEPCEPRPNSLIFRLSPADSVTPGR